MLSKFIIFSSISSAILAFFTNAKHVATQEKLINDSEIVSKQVTEDKVFTEPVSAPTTFENNLKNQESKTEEKLETSEDYTQKINEFPVASDVESDKEEEEAEQEAENIENSMKKMTEEEMIKYLLAEVSEITKRINESQKIEEVKNAMSAARKEWNTARTQCFRNKSDSNCRNAVYDAQRKYRKAEWLVFDTIQEFDKSVYDFRQFSDDFVQRHAPKLISDAQSRIIILFDSRNQHIIEKLDLKIISEGVAIKM